MLIRPCIGCGSTFAVAPKERNPRKWCSESCRVRSYRSPRFETRACSHCGAAFTSSHRGQKYCSGDCVQVADRFRRCPNRTQSFSCVECGSDFSRLAVKGNPPRRCPDCRRRAGSRPPQGIRAAVYARDEGICQICGEAVEMEAPAGSDWSPTLDHIVCVSWGGDHSVENLRLAHHWCNSIRADERAYSDADLAGVS